MITGILVILTLFVLETMLSIDNASVLALMVKDLPGNQKSKALKYGIISAFVLRGLSLFFASYLSHLWFFKLAGGVYLLCIYIKHICTDPNNGEKEVKSAISFWYTVLLVELMDLSFSLDNILASIAITNNIWLIYAGVFMGIIAMRFIAQWFTKLMGKYPSLEESSYIVIGILGIKQIIFSVFNLTESTAGQFVFSICLIIIFLLPIFDKQLKNKTNGKT